jgi:hypothetical protein
MSDSIGKTAKFNPFSNPAPQLRAVAHRTGLNLADLRDEN